MPAHTLATLTHGRYLIGEGGDPGLRLVGFHGYAQNAADALREMDRIIGGDDWQRIAIQGLHRFYNIKRGRVVASWMTSEDRELAIDDNVRWVAAVLAEIERVHGRAEKLVLCGFSQGVAMAWRATARAGLRVSALVVVGGDLPPDVRPDETYPPVLIARGMADQLYSAEKMATDLERLEGLGVEVLPYEFEGGHEWGEPLIDRVGELLGNLRVGKIQLGP